MAHNEHQSPVQQRGHIRTPKALYRQAARFALGHFRERVGQVFVTVDGIAGRAGESKRHMSVKLLPFGELTVQERGPELFEGINRAARRLERRFGRELDRIRRTKQKRESVRLAT